MILHPTELAVIFLAGAAIATLVHEGFVHPRLARRANIWRRLEQ